MGISGCQGLDKDFATVTTRIGVGSLSIVTYLVVDVD